MGTLARAVANGMAVGRSYDPNFNFYKGVTKMKILSLFDGISVARVALTKAGINVNTYYASEINTKSKIVSAHNHPDIIQLGDVRDIGHIDNLDLLIGGSPCQDLSICNTTGRQSLDGKRSGLFYEYARILQESKPKWFILENVASMNEESKNIITAMLGVEPILINAASFSAQQRNRLFWTNIPVGTIPAITKDIVRDAIDDSFTGKTYSVSDMAKPKISSNRPIKCVGYLNGNKSQAYRVYALDGKSPTLLANGGGLGAKTGLYLMDNGTIRQLSPSECETLMGLPKGYTDVKGLSNSARYTAINNAFNADVVAFILNHIPRSNK